MKDSEVSVDGENRDCRIPDVSSTTDSPTIVSIGYEQREISELIDLLAANGVSMLVDVRLNPISRKKGFSKNALATALSEAGIEYRHERELGNPKENRDPFRRGLESARQSYRRHLQNGAASVYERLVDLASTSRIALLCYERDHDQCHRSCILDAAQVDRPAMNVLHL
ncbi:MAG: DUF488 domain-containing protein [Gammaproteobacteria bacterium]|nr:DUF488 domain-containing protein [Acidimicrobiaceae bacterium]MYF30634.1 DUF488 domain-containing protein [Gammaproteobacteria bacterium]MYJ99128.1 DUF488 domain-containing protein [Acidimicrobiaceae bacterium]